MSRLKYTKFHQWVRVHDGIGTVGITEYGQRTMGEIVGIELPQEGQRCAIGEAIGVLHKSTDAQDTFVIYSPVTGRVVEVNRSLYRQPRLVNTQPTDVGWLFRIALHEHIELEALSDETEYYRYISDLD